MILMLLKQITDFDCSSSMLAASWVTGYYYLSNAQQLKYIYMGSLLVGSIKLIRKTQSLKMNFDI